MLFLLKKHVFTLFFCVLKGKRFMSASWDSKSICTFIHITKLSSKKLSVDFKRYIMKIILSYSKNDSFVFFFLKHILFISPSSLTV